MKIQRLRYLTYRKLKFDILHNANYGNLEFNTQESNISVYEIQII